MSPYEFFLLLIAAVLIAGILILFLPTQRPRRQPGPLADRQGTEPLFRDDDRHWYGGLIYYNPDDPEPLVPKRYGWGWTVNFAHPMGKLFLAIMVGMILLPVMLTVLFPNLPSYGCHPSGCSHPLFPPLP
ncbi:MAG TPA: DUF5808 domain-containing protein [Ktedonobacterales bacterium]|jgi:uncharacterized membrane protein